MKRKDLKDKATVCFRRLADGNVVGEITNEAGVVVESRNFGLLSDEELDRVFKIMRMENPDICLMPTIDLTEN